MRNTTVARRYAKALYELSVEAKSLEEVMQGLSNVCAAINSVSDLKKLLFNPLIKPDEKRDLIKAVTSNKIILKFSDLLARRKRLDLIEIILEQLQHFHDESQGLKRAFVKTAVPLTDAQKKVVEETLARSLGGKILGRFEVAKELIGGVWIKMGDKVLDASLKGRVEDFRSALLHSVN